MKTTKILFASCIVLLSFVATEVAHASTLTGTCITNNSGACPAVVAEQITGTLTVTTNGFSTNFATSFGKTFTITGVYFDAKGVNISSMDWSPMQHINFQVGT